MQKSDMGSSPVNIRKKGPDPEQIATKGFWVLNRSLGHKQLQKKNRPKSDHGKWVKLHFEFLLLALPLHGASESDNHVFSCYVILRNDVFYVKGLKKCQNT
jgi:hypothetical protein